jgi:hypothetical protein
VVPGGGMAVMPSTWAPELARVWRPGSVVQVQVSDLGGVNGAWFWTPTQVANAAGQDMADLATASDKGDCSPWLVVERAKPTAGSDFTARGRWRRRSRGWRPGRTAQHGDGAVAADPGDGPFGGLRRWATAVT